MNSTVLSSTNSVIFGALSSLSAGADVRVHIEGFDISDNADNSIAIGRGLRISKNDSDSFSFNSTDSIAESNGPGTFSVNTGGKFTLDANKTFLEHNTSYLQLSGGTINGTLSVSGSVYQQDSGQEYPIGVFSFQEGSANKTYGNYAHVEGLSSMAYYNTDASHSEGTGNLIYSQNSHVIGVSATAQEDNVFVWNGCEDESYSDHGRGTFNVNPIGGTEGFVFGTESLCSILETRKQLISEQIIAKQSELDRNSFLVKTSHHADFSENQTLNGVKEFLGAIDTERSSAVTVPTVDDAEDQTNNAASTRFAWDSLINNFLKMYPDTKVLQNEMSPAVSVRDKNVIRVYKNNQVQTISNGRLSDCPILEYCVLPNVTSIQTNALSGCPSMKQIYLGSMSSFAGSADWGLPSTCIPVR